MPTLEEINTGMGLDEILGSDAPPEVFGSLKDRSIHAFDDSLNERVEGGISELLERLLTTTDTVEQQRIADALTAELSNHTTTLDNVIDADLTAQVDLKTKREAIDLTMVILPDQVLQPELLDIVTTDQFKELTAIYVEADEAADDEEDDEE